ncbi:MAG TPA: polysaccharide deacetylase family protein [Candidatus Binataceae bacterium]|nr:polysaccharide deacetylase family protein [Candidatus Binataceae bacterium]
MMQRRDSHSGSELAAAPQAQSASALVQKLPVLLYHSISRTPRPAPFEYLVISPETFEAQIRGLSRAGYSSIRAPDILRWQREGTPLPAKPVLITFDDAFVELAERAFPILGRYGFTATVFVITGLSGAQGSFEGRRVLTLEQIRHWARQGIEFGSHTRTHPDLTALDSSALEREIAGSADDLRAILGAPVTSFAYPYGRLTDSVRRVVERFYGAAFTCEEAIDDQATNSFLLRRTIVNPADTAPEFSARLRYGRNSLRHFFKPYRVWKRLSGRVAARLTARNFRASSPRIREG